MLYISSSVSPEHYEFDFLWWGLFLIWTSGFLGHLIQTWSLHAQAPSTASVEKNWLDYEDPEFESTSFSTVTVYELKG